MAENSAIAWTDHTMNFWLGCTEASVPGCATCYARELDKRYQWGVPGDVAKANRAAGIAPHWGPGAPRHRTAASNWRKPFKWNADAEARSLPYKVFTSSLSDIFDNEVDPQWRVEAWKIIRATPHLRWQLLTKRVPNISKMLPADWGDGYPNVGLVASVVTQDEMNRDAYRLLKVPARWHGFSLEPQVEWIGLPEAVLGHGRSIWVITGGDSAQPTSGQEPRPYYVSWARALIAQARQRATIKVFVKQLGAAPVGAETQTDSYAGEIMDEWPEDIRVREFVPELLV